MRELPHYRDDSKTRRNQTKALPKWLLCVIAVIILFAVRSVWISTPDNSKVQAELAELKADVDRRFDGLRSSMKKHDLQLRQIILDVRAQRNSSLPDDAELTTVTIPDVDTLELPKPRGKRWVFGHVGDAQEDRREAVKEAFQWAWKGYKEFSWGKDELLPISKRFHDESFKMALTMVDALDTMLIMDLTDDFKECEEWLATEFKDMMEHGGNVNLFETTIRILGGLLSAHALTENVLWADLAEDLGRRLAFAFLKSPTDIPHSDVNIKTGDAKSPAGVASTSEATTLQLEFRYLSKISGNGKFNEMASAADRAVAEMGGKTDGLVPIYISPTNAHFSGNQITLGARGDSYYEYLLKQWLLTNRTEPVYKERYVEAMDGVTGRLIGHSTNGLLFIGELPAGGVLSPKMDHLVCFLAGSLALGHARGITNPQHLKIGEELAETCVKTYQETPTGLAPEITHFEMSGSKDLRIKPNDAHNILRPETVESLFILYRITKDNKYREWGWEIFQAFLKHAKISTGGFASLESVMQVPVRHRDKMESFFLAETLKYLYLLFDDSGVVPLDKFVFNTEAHPLPIWTPS